MVVDEWEEDSIVVEEWEEYNMVDERGRGRGTL